MFLLLSEPRKMWEKLFCINVLKPPHSWLPHKWSCDFDIKRTDFYYAPSVHQWPMSPQRWLQSALESPCSLLALPQSHSWSRGLAAVRDKTPSLRICLEKITKQKNCQPVSVCSLLRPGSSVIWILQSSIKVELPCSPILLHLIHAFLLITADSLGNRRPCCSLLYALGKALVALLDDQ